MPLLAHEYLEQHNIPYEAQTFLTSTEKGAANVANALGFRERQMIKTLIYMLGDTGEYILVMVGGDQNVKSGLLKKAAGSRNISMASPDAIIALTGYAIGSIPPFCWHPQVFRSFLDSSLLDEEQLGVGAGEWGQEIIITPQNLVQATNAEVVQLVADE
jgi:Cys-tRNA(Pro)/Cys-tRNA(Cys) deacylase